MDRTPRPGEFYRHFKDKMYQIVCLAHHSETDEMLVVYQALYGEFKICARPLDMFVSEVDHEKYPEVTQKYRFEKTSVDEVQKFAVSSVNGENKTSEDIRSTVSGNSYNITEKLTGFLDADTYREKLLILESMKSYMNEELIDSVALSLDLIIKPGSIEDQYEQLVYGLKTLMRFEDTRLR